ncbi:tellurite resistance TerB family protein [Salipiger mucosus]|uniref:Tellurite resistance TerB family protein n=1 Tax=Salipiger mucosus DSM 16094 TaxID=1123237 RepID=S9RWT3_9RHOB|nr:tellurite resistance TerB family protein [Salipiger mucosus]EPX78464.1 hypothetical protein Salmuc_03574 [Salipiger mucosus DSM 16094]
MGLMGTLAKVAIGYAAARGVDRLSGGQGFGALLRGGAQVPGKEPGTQMQARMGEAMAGRSNPLQDMMASMQQGGLGALLGSMGNMGAMTGAATGGPGAASDTRRGLLSAMSDQSGPGLAGLLAAAGGAAISGGRHVGGMVDQFRTAETAPEAEKTAALMLRAMIQAAKADGEIDQAERAKILDTLGADADRADVAFVEDQIAAPLDPEGLAGDTPPALRTQVYAASLMTMRVDTPEEAQYLDRLAKAMALPETGVNVLHMQMGLQPLYA